MRFVEKIKPYTAKAFYSSWWMVLAPAILLSMVSCFRLLGLGRDHAAYLVFFARSRELPLFRMASEVGIDFGFAALLKMFSWILPSHDALWLFLITFMGLTAKFYCFRRLAPA